MKKFNMFGIMALILICALSGCEDDEKTPASMTFVDNVDSIAKEFVIDEDYGFKVKFINPSETERNLTIEEGNTVSGRITDADTAWNNSLTGVADKMSSNNKTINGAVEALKVPISLTYEKNANNEITSVTVSFSGTGIGQTAQTLMGATYIRKN
jgi:uncharacterized lipoprotein YehR (DUF1307 family)